MVSALYAFILNVRRIVNIVYGICISTIALSPVLFFRITRSVPDPSSFVFEYIICIA